MLWRYKKDNNIASHCWDVILNTWLLVGYDPYFIFKILYYFHYLLTDLRMCMGTQSAFTTEPLNGCLRNLVGMKCSWSRTCIKMCRPYPPRGGSRVKQTGHWLGGGPLLQKTSSDWKATATNRMHSNDLEACEMKCCCFWFHSEVKFFDTLI